MQKTASSERPNDTKMLVDRFYEIDFIKPQNIILFYGMIERYVLVSSLNSRELL